MGDLAKTAVVHPTIVTADLDSAIRYYRDILGLIPGEVTAHDPQRHARLTDLTGSAATAGVLTAAGGGEIELAQFRAPGGRPSAQESWPDAGIRSVTFRVSDLEGTVRCAALLGYPVAGEVARFAGPVDDVLMVYVNAPDGVLVTLMQAVPKPVEDVATPGDMQDGAGA